LNDTFQGSGTPDFGLVIGISMNYDTFRNHWKENSLFMRRILIVDHDIKILNVMSKAFRAADYEVVTADSGFSALEILEIADVDLVISDLRLPLMDGYELLSKIKELHPDVIRIIMSSYIEESSVFKAIVQIFETEDILKSNDLLLLINSVEKLPTIETSYQKILSMIERDVDTGQIAAEIEKDFAISSRLLQIANSAYYGLRTGSIKHATVYLGLQNLKSLIYSTSILNSYRSGSEHDQQRVQNLWTHALLTSKLLHYIYEVFLNKKLPETAYSAGLLHNVGTLILIQSRFEDYTKAVDKASPKTLNMLALEQETFRVTHQEAGG
jgi:CheY-like chemotaxis protein